MTTEVITIVDPDQGAGYDYASLSLWESDFGNTTTGNLPSDDMIATAKCRCTSGTADTTAVTISGWTTDATRYIKIWTDQAETYRHDGKWNVAKYRIAPTGSTVITVGVANVKIYGLQINPNGSGTYHGIYSSGNNLTVAYCIIKGSGSVTTGTGLWHDAYGTNYFYNIVVYGFTTDYVAGINGGSGTCYVYNVTSHGNYRSFAGSSAICVNCIASSPAENAFQGVSASSDYNSSSTGTASGGAHDLVNQTFSFVNSTTDFHLQSGDTGAKDHGLSDPGSGLFSDDIDGQTRTGTWDIGADEYVAAGSTPIECTLTESLQWQFLRRSI